MAPRSISRSGSSPLALGLTPVVLLVDGRSCSSSWRSPTPRGPPRCPRTAARRPSAPRLQRLFGFVTGWASSRLPDRDRPLGALPPALLGGGLQVHSLREARGTSSSRRGIAGSRLLASRPADVAAPTCSVVALLDLLVQSAPRAARPRVPLLALDALDGWLRLRGQDWLDDLAFAIPLGFLAYTGLETVANLAEEAREPGRTLPRSLFSAIGLVVVLTVLIGGRRRHRYPADDGDVRARRPVARGAARRHRDGVPGRASRRVSSTCCGRGRAFAALILMMAITTSISGCARLATRWGRTAAAARDRPLDRRTLVARETIGRSRASRSAVVGIGSLAGDEATFLASTTPSASCWPSRGAAGRYPPPPRRARSATAVSGPPRRAVRGVASRSRRCRRAADLRDLGARDGDAQGRAVAGPAWLVVGLVVYGATRWRERKGVFEDVDPRNALPVGPSFRRILVPMKLGDIGEEMVATAVALAKESGADGGGDHRGAGAARAAPRAGAAAARPSPSQADASVAEARALGEENGVDVRAEAVNARSIGYAIVDEATRRQAAAIPVLGSSPRWRRQSRFSPPTVDHVLRHAPSVALVVALPRRRVRRSNLSPHEGGDHRLRARRVVRGETAGRRGLGHHRASTTTRWRWRASGNGAAGLWSATGWTLDVLDRAGAAKADAASSPPTATTRISSSARCFSAVTGSVASSSACSTLFEPTSLPSAGCGRSARRTRSLSRSMPCGRATRRRWGARSRPCTRSSREREGRRERHPLARPDGARVDASGAARATGSTSSKRSSGRPCQRRRDRAPCARAGWDRSSARYRARGHRRRRGQYRDRADRQGGMRRRR